MSTERGRGFRDSRAWVEIDRQALRANLETIRRRVGSHVGLIPMVKADAYGLGVGEVVRTFEPLDPLAYGVAAVQEGIDLRERGVTRPVIVFSPVVDDECEDAVEHGLTLSVSSMQSLRALDRASQVLGRDTAFHVDVDTGMGRSGFDWNRGPEWIPRIAELQREGLAWEGCYTHFHSADLTDPVTVHEQWARFREVVDAGVDERVCIHACNSAAALSVPELAADAVRPGIFLFGGRAGETLDAPAPVVSLRARVTLVREVAAGTSVGYGATWVADRPSRLATLGIGYGDGFPRALSNRGRVLIRGSSAPIVGRISMDVTVVDVSHVPAVECGDVATLIGSDGSASISVDEVAESVGTISYEVLTQLTARLPRLWRD